MTTITPKRILCPVDFSDQSARALQVAGTVALAFGAEVTVLHAQRIEAPLYFTAAQTKALETQLRRAAQPAKQQTADFAKKHLPPEVVRQIVVVEREPVSAILQVQKEIGAQLIAMGTHGRGGLARVRLGSIAESILHHAEIPVLTVGSRALAAGAGPINRVLCPVDYLETAQHALRHAAALAEQTGAELTIAHIDEASTDANSDEAMSKMCDWVSTTVRAHCVVREIVRRGSAAEQIIQEAAESRADILVVGAKPRDMLGSIILGSTTDLVIRSAPCSVLSVINKMVLTTPDDSKA